MIVELKQIPDEGLAVAFEEAIHLAEEAGAGEAVYAVQAEVRLMKIGMGVDVRGRFRASANISCGRCLEPFVQNLAEDFEVQYLPAPTLAGDEEYELSGSEMDVLPLVEDRIDLGALLRENLLLSLPVQPVCRESCRGLCPRCGTPLNAGPCGCSSERLDPRLQALAKFRPGRPPNA
jgi:uncharacterized protein